jgi:glucan-binding YG repeat protein
LTGVPFSTYGWNSKLEGSKIGDIITFHGSGNKVSYKVIAKNTDIISNPDAFAVPGTLMVLIQPNQSSGHIAVSLGEFARQEGEYDPKENPEEVLQTTMEYVTGILSQRYGIDQDLLLGENLITQYPNTWMEKKYLGTDILLDDGTYSGQYNKIWRVEAYSDSTGVCVTNAAKGTNGLNAKYVLLPVTDDANSNSNTVAYQEKNSIDDIKISNITSEGYQVDVTVTASSGIKQVLMPTWTVANGQDDIVWHQATINGRVASAKISSSEHNEEAGEYITHVYLYSNSGKVQINDVYIDLTDCSQTVSFTHKHGWDFVDGKWYYYNERREKSTGWLNLNGNWYYMKLNGSMAVGWCLVGNNWYYMAESGVMVTGWLNLNGTWYYMGNDGAMLTGTHTINGNTYVFNQDGVWISD